MSTNNSSEELYRQDTAACVSLSKSTISKTRTGSTGPNCLAPVRGGGGDLVASKVCVKNFFWKKFSRPNRSGDRRRRRLSRPPNPCQVVLFKELLSTKPNPGELGGGGFLKTPEPPVNRAFQPIHRTRNRSFRDRRKPPRKAAWLPRFVTEAIRLKRGNYANQPREARPFRTPPPRQNPRKLASPKAPRPARLRARAGCRPPTPESARGIFEAGQLSGKASLRERDAPARPTPPLYRYAGSRLPGWPRRSGTSRGRRWR